VNLAAAIFIDGLIDASWLFIVAVGLTLVFGVLNILNFAHGSLYAVGAYTAASAVDWYYGGNFGPAFLGYFLMLAAALLVAVALGPLLERSVLRLFFRRDEVVLVLVTYALFLILEDATKLIWGVDPYYAYEPYGLLGNVSIFGLSYVGIRFRAGRVGAGNWSPAVARTEPDYHRKGGVGGDP
jgi:branched-chain amino acid transport system permease protein